jgi:hypothetical protein
VNHFSGAVDFSIEIHSRLGYKKGRWFRGKARNPAGADRA